MKEQTLGASLKNHIYVCSVILQDVICEGADTRRILQKSHLCVCNAIQHDVIGEGANTRRIPQISHLCARIVILKDVIGEGADTRRIPQKSPTHTRTHTHAHTRKPPQASGKVRRENANRRRLGAGQAESKRAEQQKVMIQKVMTSNNRTELKEQKGFATVLEERKPPQASGKVRREGANGRSLGARQEESNPSTPAERANGRRHPAKCTPLRQQSEQTAADIQQSTFST